MKKLNKINNKLEGFLVWTSVLVSLIMKNVGSSVFSKVLQVQNLVLFPEVDSLKKSPVLDF